MALSQTPATLLFTLKKLLNGYGYTSSHTGIKSSHTSRFCAQKSCILMYESLIHLLCLHSFLHVSPCSFIFFVIPKPNSFVGWLFEKGLELWRVHASGRFFRVRSQDQHCPGFNQKSVQKCLVYLQFLANLVGIFEESLNVWIGINPFTGWNSKETKPSTPLGVCQILQLFRHADKTSIFGIQIT